MSFSLWVTLTLDYDFHRSITEIGLQLLTAGYDTVQSAQVGEERKAMELPHSALQAEAEVSG